MTSYTNYVLFDLKWTNNLNSLMKLLVRFLSLIIFFIPCIY